MIFKIVINSSTCTVEEFKEISPAELKAQQEKEKKFFRLLRERLPEEPIEIEAPEPEEE